MHICILKILTRENSGTAIVNLSTIYELINPDQKGLFVVKYISCLLFMWFAQATKVFLQQKFPDLQYVTVL